MSCRNAYLAAADSKNEYATSEDDRRTCAEERSRLYLLSFLLTADHAKAKQCFVSGLDLSAEDTPACREWADSWARQIIVNNALRLIAPHPDAGREDVNSRRPASGCDQQVSVLMGST
jgi:hypothetical protein